MIHSVDGKTNASDNTVERQGAGTIGDSQMVGGASAPSMIFSTDPRIKYFSETGVQDIYQGSYDVNNKVALANDSMKFAFSYTPTENVNLYQVLLRFSAFGATTVNMSVQADSAGSPSGTSLVSAYDELTRAVGITGSSQRDVSQMTGFHIYLNNANAALDAYIPGQIQNRYALTAGTKYWFVFGVTGTTSDTTIPGKVREDEDAATAVKKYDGSSWVDVQGFVPSFAIILSGWKQSYSVSGSYGGVTHQLANYPYVSSGYGAVYAGGYGAGTARLVDSFIPSVSGVDNMNLLLPMTVEADAACSKGPYLKTTINSSYVGFVQDIIEKMSYKAAPLDDCTWLDLANYVNRKELVLYVDGVPQFVITDGGSNIIPFIDGATASYNRALTNFVSNLGPGDHEVKVGLRYYRFLRNTSAGGGGGAGAPFAEANSVPDQIRFEGFETRPRLSLDNMALYGYSVKVSVTTNASGFAKVSVPAPVGYTIVAYTGGYADQTNPGSLIVSVGTGCVILHNAAATTSYNVRVMLLISPTKASIGA